MIELRWSRGVLEQRTRHVCSDAAGAFCQFTDWSEWHPVPIVPEPNGEPSLPSGITYGGSGLAGEYYSKPYRNDAHSIWTKGEESWTSAELRAIADHQDWVASQFGIPYWIKPLAAELVEPVVGPNIPKAFPAPLQFDDDDDDIMNSPPLVGIQRQTIELILSIWDQVQANRKYAHDCLSLCGPGESPYPVEHARVWAERERLLGDTLVQSMPELGPVLERILNLKGTL
jgi:hypothetical protein